MKRILITIAAIIAFSLVAGYIGIYLWIGSEVQKNIDLAKSKYPGKAEDALIAYLLDETNSPQNRSHVAVWTLGQIQSKKAIPILEGLYQNDPKGKTCKGHHNAVLCQYEIYKALNAQKVNWWPLHANLNK
jgi:hypothetical protein